MPEIELSRLDLDESQAPRRSPPRSPEHRQPDYDEKFDFFTVLYDCFAAPYGRRLVCLGPPLFNLEPTVVPAIERAFLRPRHGNGLSCRHAAPTARNGAFTRSR